MAKCPRRMHDSAFKTKQDGLSRGSESPEGKHNTAQLATEFGFTSNKSPNAPASRLSKPQQGHTIYPYLLKGLMIDQSNQVWSTDITYVPMANGFLYLSGRPFRFLTTP